MSDLSSALAATTLEQIRTERERRRRLQQQSDLDQSIDASKERSRTLAGFIRESWHVVEPNTTLVWGWHIDAFCTHLEAITYGQITRLLVNIPPGTMKSLVVSVFWPAWEWGPAGLPGMRYFTSSYKEDYVARDSRKMRDLIRSDWYQVRWGERTALERFGETSFSNIAGGWREGVVFKSMTGGRGDRVIIDDPHSVDTAESEAERRTVIRTFRESVTSRLMDPEKSAIVIVMQRLHTEDVAGVALSLNLGYTHLMLPMEFEPDRRCETAIGFRDPRTYDGELLFPERFTRTVVDRDKLAMGSYAVAGQYQQRPTLREGGLFKRAWFKFVDAAKAGTRFVRYWDLAATEEQLSSSSAYTAGVKLGRQPDGSFIVDDVARLRAEGLGVRRLVRETARDDGVHVDIGFPQDPGQAGKVQAQSMVTMLAQFNARPVRETGDKVTRAEPIAAQAEAGLLYLVKGDWNDAFIDELCNFPGGKFKDQVDALSGAYGMLIGAAMFTTPEDQIAIEGSFRIPSTWPRVLALDVGNGVFSMVWAAYQPSSDVVYVYDCLARPLAGLPIHVAAARERGSWIPAVFHIKGDDRTQDQGLKIGGAFQSFGMDVYDVNLDIEAACADMAMRFDAGKLRVFHNLTDWFGQYRRLSRNEKGEIDDADAGILRATGLLLSGLSVAITEARASADRDSFDPRLNQTGSMTGY